LPGLGLDDCLPIGDDSLDATVAWKEGRGLGGKRRVRLQFELRQAALFSFWVD
jgi:hypothetical protein